MMSPATSMVDWSVAPPFYTCAWMMEGYEGPERRLPGAPDLRTYYDALCRETRRVLEVLMHFHHVEAEELNNSEDTIPYVTSGQGSQVDADAGVINDEDDATRITHPSPIERQDAFHIPIE